jgi:hypothetical protein
MITSKRDLMKVYFSLKLSLTLSTVTAVEVKGHEEPLMEVMVFYKMGPATPEVHLAVPVVPHLYLIGSSSSRVSVKDCFTKFPPIHELSKFQWHPLNFMALSAGDAEEGINFRRRRRRSIMRRSARTWCSTINLGLVLTPHRAARVP